VFARERLNAYRASREFLALASEHATFDGASVPSLVGRLDACGASREFLALASEHTTLNGALHRLKVK
jgi:hypothetical protein